MYLTTGIHWWFFIVMEIQLLEFDKARQKAAAMKLISKKKCFCCSRAEKTKCKKRIGKLRKT